MKKVLALLLTSLFLVNCSPAEEIEGEDTVGYDHLSKMVGKSFYLHSLFKNGQFTYLDKDAVTLGVQSGTTFQAKILCNSYLGEINWVNDTSLRFKIQKQTQNRCEDPDPFSFPAEAYYRFPGSGVMEIRDLNSAWTAVFIQL